MAVLVRFKGETGGLGNHQIGHRGGVVQFTNNEAVVSDAVLQEWLDEGYPIEKAGEIDPARQPTTNYFAYHGPNQVAAMEREMLSKQNVGDFPGLGTDLELGDVVGNIAVNHADSPVNMVNNNAAIDRPVNPDNRLSPNRIPLVEMTDEEKERTKQIRAAARDIRAKFGVPTDETNALHHDFRLTTDATDGEMLDPEDRASQVALKAEVEAGTASGELQSEAPEYEASTPQATRGATTTDRKTADKESDIKPKADKSSEKSSNK